jgi:hypothetical protein
MVYNHSPYINPRFLFSEVVEFYFDADGRLSLLLKPLFLAYL